ncbi:3-deoxy-D-manno-octulosonic acid transferase [Piscinibacter sakaiensis]|uniref:3-deoxy-D-manno-octulosonic acid transferase n=1 Tax=Piscinibacter sakaiensis TaxID=1547922 RepID=UPI003AAFC98D
MTALNAPPVITPLRRRSALLAYGWLMRLLMPVLLLRLVWRGRAEPLYRRWIGERLGFYPPSLRAQIEPGRLWLHAVSLGETRAAAALVTALRAQQPGLRLLLTHGTATGREAGRALLRDGDLQVWAPWDTPGAVRRFLARHRPAAGVLMETEIWPALLDAARRRGVPMLLANARLSERSLRRQQSWPALMVPAMASLEQALAQTESDAQRLQLAGAASTLVCGNLKFDMSPDPALLSRGIGWREALRRPVVMMASSREGEEPPLLDAWRNGPGRRSDQRADAPLLLLVPRHPQRFDEVAAMLRAAGLTLARRSEWADMPPEAAAGADVWLGDSLGELPLYYAVADVALLGGSFAPLGGQNLIEAAACGCPLLIGPSSFNFAEAAELAIAAGAAARVADIGAALDAATVLLADDARRRRQAESALAFAAGHRGAAQRMAVQVIAALGADNRDR